ELRHERRMRPAILQWSRDGQCCFISISNKSIIYIDNNLIYKKIYLSNINPLSATTLDDEIEFKLNFNNSIITDNLMINNNENNKSLCFNEGRYPLIIATGDEAVRSYDLAGRLGSTFEGHTGTVRFIASSGSMRLVVSHSDDGTFRLWRLKDGAT